MFMFSNRVRGLATVVLLSLLSIGSSAFAQPLDPNAVLRFGMESDVVTFDPHKAPSYRDQPYLFAVYDRLVHFTPDGDTRPGLAESWSVSADGKVYEFKLRKGVKFHDGTSFDAAAVKANLDRGLSLPGSTVKGDLADIADVTVVDPSTVRLTLARPNSMLLTKLSGRPGCMISPAAMNSPDLGSRPVGAGMFKLDEYVRGRSAVFSAWKGYWEPSSVKLAGLELRFMKDAARVNALLTRELDAAGVPPADIDRLRARGVSVKTDGSSEFMYFLLNWTKPPLDKLEVRKALQFALNRKALVDMVEFGNGVPTFQPVNPNSAEYEKALDSIFRPDQDEARRLLRDSGVKDPQLTLLTFQGNEQNNRLNQAVQAQLEAVGFKVTLRVVDRARAPQLLFAAGGVHGMAAGGSVFPRALLAMDVYYRSSGRLNMGHKSGAEMDEAVEKGFAATSDKDASKWAAVANRYAVENVYSPPLYFTLSPLAQLPDVVGLRKTNSDNFEFYNVGKRLSEKQ